MNNHIIITSVFLFSLLTLLSGKAIAQQSFEDKYHTAKQNNDTLSMVRALWSWGDSLSWEGDFVLSDSLFLKAVDLTQKQKDHFRTGILYNDLAANVSYVGKHELALVYYDKALKAFTTINDIDRIAMILVNMGAEYCDAGDMERAMEYKIKALEKKLTSDKKKDLETFYQGVGELFKETDIDKWEEYTQKAYEAAQKQPNGNLYTKAKIFNDLAGICEAKGQNQKALAWYDSVLVVSQQNNYLEGMAVAYSNRSILFMNEQNYSKALAETRKAIEIDDKTGRVCSQISARVRAANVLREMHDYRQATRYANEALNKAQKLKNYPKEAGDAHLSLADIGEKTKNWQMAYTHYKAYQTINDSLQNVEVRKSLHDMELKYQTAEKNRTIEKLDNENKLNKAQLDKNRILIITLIISSLLIVLSGLFITTRRQLKQQKRQAELKQKLLRSQINPHFMFNALGAIQAYMIDHTNEDTMQYLFKFSQLMRNILDSSRANTISLEQETAIISDYLSLQQLRFENKFDYSIIVDDTLDKDIEIPPMLLQPFVENAVEHGIKSLGEATQGKIDVNFRKQGSALIMSVKDNGKGFGATSETGNKNHVSHATNIVKEHIDTLNKINKRHIQLDIRSVPEQGVEVTVKMAMG